MDTAKIVTIGAVSFTGYAYLYQASQKNKGYFHDMEHKSKSPMDNYIQDNVDYPTFGETADIVGGLTMAMNDIWGTNVKI